MAPFYNNYMKFPRENYLQISGHRKYVFLRLTIELQVKSGLLVRQTSATLLGATSLATLGTNYSTYLSIVAPMLLQMMFTIFCKVFRTFFIWFKI